MTPDQMVDQIFAKWNNPHYLKLHAGELTAQEVRTVRAVLSALRWQLIESMPALKSDERT